MAGKARHGMSKTPTYTNWGVMKYRCSPKAKKKNKKNYYEKGVSVCDRWQCKRCGKIIRKDSL